MKKAEKNLNLQLWHACAGGMIQTHILCCVAFVKFLGDPEIDEFFSKITLIPLRNSELKNEDSDGSNGNVSESFETPASFAKTLTQSDAINGGGISVPRYCAKTIFPQFDYSTEPPVQIVIAMDVHSEVWKFRHIYRGKPMRHLLTG
ncbi:unnamed protein product [Lathyrus sativus]|nr:unnamed protein product [Lathyrus sativus]